MSSTAQEAIQADSPPSRALLHLSPFVLIIFLGYAAIGLPLAALPIYVHEHLGYGTIVVGLVVALQSVATLLTRAFAGHLCDSRGGRTSVLLGALCCAASGLFYLAGLWIGWAAGSLAFILVGRLVAGLGESLVITGILAWSIARVGASNTGKAMVWTGIGMYGAIAAGGAAGLALYNAGGLAAVSLAVIVAPLVAILVTVALPAARGVAGARLPFYRVVGLIWRQGTGLALASIGFGAISAFIALDFQAQGWSGTGLGLAAFGIGYIITRLFCGHFPDKFGSANVVVWSLLVELLGLAALWLAPGPTVAQAGAFLTGAGYSLVFPSFGIEAVKRVPAANRGAALGAYVMFFDIGLATAGPVTGTIAGHFGYPAAFGAGAISVALALATRLAGPGRRV
ncbi:MFS family permease [Rhizobium sp. BK313]|jgi:MFS family permease|uniref:MFS transporter n=1 Tax=Rhizobium sp. BK313 TaxID=2587081 RepID=UPI00105C0624|nr:MFS transporter [Rhizobium sp. BK313]MBB3455365.1 MFS family permease [Rhizobium sp. BK313]